MSSGRPNNVDARGAVFNKVGRDQLNVQHYNVYISLGSVLRLQFPFLGSLLSLRLSGSDSLPDQNDNSACNPSACPATDIAVRLIDEILQMLVAADARNQFRELKEELRMLQQTIALIELAIEAYKRKLLGRSLASIITKEAGRCLWVLQRLLNTINVYQQALNSTRITSFWSRVWWNASEPDDLAFLINTLSDRRKSLGRVLASLELVSFN
jgi:hypothetical protein